MFEVLITDLAQSDIQQAFDWWSENRSRLKAVHWYEQIFVAIGTLREMPDRCPLVPEVNLSKKGVRQLLFGVGTRPSHRIVFTINPDVKTITILRIRHHGQSEL